MSLNTPLGLIALIGLAILLLIYLIKPTYQSKILSSTYIWKESLKYKKGERPTSKLRNLLLIICQVLIISITALILATPFVNAMNNDRTLQSILIIDSGANMQLEANGTTRFQRAISEAKSFSEDAIKKNKPVSIIVADGESNMILTKESNIEVINGELDKLECSFSVADLAGALDLANELIKTNSLADVSYITGTDYKNIGDVNVINVSDESDWNAGILDVRYENVENYFEFYVDVAVYGSDKYVNLSIMINDANNDNEVIRAEKRVNCTDGNTVTVKFKDLGVYSFTSADIKIKMDDGSTDGFIYDDSFALFGGEKEELNIEYVSSKQNNFFSGSLMVLRDSYKDSFNINIKEVSKISESKLDGYDLYIFEHIMPPELPKDGAVLLVNPDTMPVDIGISIGEEKTGDFKCAAGIKHDITKYLSISDIGATSYKALNLTDGYESLMTINGDSVFAVNDKMKVSILTLNLNKSNLPLLLDFPVMVNNLFEHFIPKTIDKRVYNVDEKFMARSRGLDLKLINGDEESILNNPTELSLATPGRYSIKQSISDNKSSKVDFYIRVNEDESNVSKGIVNLDGLFEIKRPNNVMTDIYMYLSIGLVALLILERFLHSKEGM